MSVSLKLVAESDLENLMNWRMNPEINRYMMSDVTLTMESQKKWFASLQKSDSQIRWVIWLDDIPIGSIYITNIDKTNKNAEIGVYIAEKEYRSLHMLLQIHWNVYDYIFGCTDINRLYGCIMQGNEGMIRFSIAHGCLLEGKFHQHIFKNDKFHDLSIVGITKERWAEFKKTVEYDKYEVEGVAR